MKQGDKIKIFMDTEEVIDNDFPVNYNYLYIIDSKVFRSDVQGTILTLKRDLYKRKLIESLDVEARRFEMSRLYL